jgi:SAM-dependent methyltransferase
MNSLNALEIGCGYSAKNLIAIERKCKKITGIDFNLSAEIKKNPKFIGLESSIDSGLETLSKDKFDLIMIISVLEHLINPEETLFKCRNLLNENGILLINVPTWTGKLFLEFSAFRFGLSPKEEMDDHKMYYNKRDLWPILVKSGFLPSKIKMHYHKFYLNLFSIAKK